jgi:hypothetical protein
MHLTKLPATPCNYSAQRAAAFQPPLTVKTAAIDHSATLPWTLPPCHLRPATYALPPTPCHLRPATYALPPTPCHSPSAYRIFFTGGQAGSLGFADIF